MLKTPTPRLGDVFSRVQSAAAAGYSAIATRHPNETFDVAQFPAGNEEDTNLLVSHAWDSRHLQTLQALMTQKLPVVDNSPLSVLSRAMRNIFTSEAQLGFHIRNDQPVESFVRTDAGVRSVMSAYTRARHTDWQKFVFFNESHYTRNLVYANDDFELMVICWAPGQHSRIHNHAASHCWMACLQGEIQEVQYKLPGSGESMDSLETDDTESQAGSAVKPVAAAAETAVAPGSQLLQQVGINTLLQGGMTYINDKLGLHSVGCPFTVAAPGAVTLHLYAPPIKRVDIYHNKDTNSRVQQQTPGFYSIQGLQQ